MAKDNIAYHSMRLNLNNEQHLRVHNVLKDLNIGIHKSVNQFILEAIDFYIRSFEEDDLTNKTKRNRQKGQDYIRKCDIDEIKKELQSEMKDEFIRVFGTIIAGGQITSIPEKKFKGLEEEREESTVMTDLASKWG